MTTSSKTSSSSLEVASSQRQFAPRNDGVCAPRNDGVWKRIVVQKEKYGKVVRCEAGR